MSKVINFETRLKDNEQQDRLIKRFLKKSSKTTFLKEHIENMHFVSESEKNRYKRKRKLKLARKFNEQNVK